MKNYAAFSVVSDVLLAAVLVYAELVLRSR